MMKELDNMTPEELGKLFPIIISPPDKKWAEYYTAEKERIHSALNNGEIISIEHIGSTAIPDIMAKPTIDVLIEIKADTDHENLKDRFNELGYHFIPRPDKPAPHMMFLKGYTKQGFKGQAFHIHIRYKGDQEEIRFRDYLLKHPQAVKEYEELKLKLAKKYPNDRDAYTEAKTGFVNKIARLTGQKS